jgi:hypothetical protein
MSDTPPGDTPQSGRVVGDEARVQPDEDITEAGPAPGYGPISAASETEATAPTVPVAKSAPAHDQLAPYAPIPYTEAPQSAAPPAYQPPPSYAAPGYPPAYAPPQPFPTTGYVPPHAYDPPAPSYTPSAAEVPPMAYPTAPASPLPVPEPPPPLAPAPRPPRMDGVAVASLICSILGIPLLVVACIGVPFCLTGIVMGFVARHRIQHANGQLSGDGAAMSAIVVGAVGIGFFVLLLASFLVNAGGGRSTY